MEKVIKYTLAFLSFCEERLFPMTNGSKEKLLGKRNFHKKKK